MRRERLEEITRKYGRLKVAVVGDLCLDRYFEIDPGIEEVSIETKLPVYNITRVRCQPGGAGTILNNLGALGAGEIYITGIIGHDGEGYELRRAIENQLQHARLEYLVESPLRRTFTYTKPLLMEKSGPPVELNRLDIKNWTPTPEALQQEISEAVEVLAGKVDVMILLDQVDVPESGVVTRQVLETVRRICAKRPDLLVIGDSRRGLKEWPPISYKMNGAELAALTGKAGGMKVEEARDRALKLAGSTGRHVFVTLSEKGILGVEGREACHVKALPTRGPIDIVGAGDAVTANLASALAAGASLRESLEIASLAASVVIHQLGTTGTASPHQILELLLKSDLLEP